jgi:hypothetical protein
MAMKANDTQAPVQFDAAADGNLAPPPVTDEVRADGARFSALMKQPGARRPGTKSTNAKATDVMPQPRAAEATAESEPSSMPAMPSLARFDKPTSGEAKNAEEHPAPDAASEAAPSLALTPVQLRERAIKRKALGLDGGLPKSKSSAHTVQESHDATSAVAVAVAVAGAAAVASTHQPNPQHAQPQHAQAQVQPPHARARDVVPVVREAQRATPATQANPAMRAATKVATPQPLASKAPVRRAEAAMRATPATPATPPTPANTPVAAAHAADAQPAQVPSAAASADSAPATQVASDDAPSAKETRLRDMDPIDASGELPAPVQEEKLQRVTQERVAQEVGAQVMAQQVHLNLVNTTPQDSPLVEIIKEL